MTTTGGMDLILDWMVVAGVYGRGVRLLASKTLKPPTTVEIVEAETAGTFGGKPVTTWQHEHYRITILAEDVVVVDAETYSKAIQLLFTIFQPNEPATPVANVLASARLCPSCRSRSPSVRLYSVIADGGRGGHCEDQYHERQEIGR